MGGRQLLTPRDETGRSQDVVKGEELADRRVRNFASHLRMDQHGIELRGEDDLTVDLTEKQGLFPGAVARQEQPALVFVPKGKSEHAVEAIEALHIPALVSGENDLGIAACTKTNPAGL